MLCRTLSRPTLTDHALAPGLALSPRRPAKLTSHEDAWAGAGAIIAKAFPGGGYKVLEAGGGSLTALGSLKDAEFTVIDISPEQLERNGYAKTRLLGDLQAFDAYPDRYDVIVCRDVLEHLDAPEKAIDRLLAALAPGGLLVIGGPVPTSFKGLLTKWSPHWFHVAFYRLIMGEPDAGKPGHAPFRAYMNFCTRPEALKAKARKAGFICVFEALTPPSWMLSRMAKVSPLIPLFYNAAMAVMRAASLGTWRPDLSDMILVFRR
jgi:SAM-dependent methyltransferase